MPKYVKPRLPEQLKKTQEDLNDARDEIAKLKAEIERLVRTHPEAYSSLIESTNDAFSHEDRGDDFDTSQGPTNDVGHRWEDSQLIHDATPRGETEAWNYCSEEESSSPALTETVRQDDEAEQPVPSTMTETQSWDEFSDGQHEIPGPIEADYQNDYDDQCGYLDGDRDDQEEYLDKDYQDNFPESEPGYYYCVTCTRYKRDWDDTSDNALSERSRLHDRDFYSDCRSCTGSAATLCNLPYKYQQQVLKNGLRLAQEVVWCALRHHFPEWQLRVFPESPQEVRFGREEVAADFPDFEDALRLRHDSLYSLLSCVTDIIFLRNAVAHPGRHSGAGLDNLVEKVQTLAVHVGDERRAFKIRALRDDIQGMLKRMLAEIEAFEPLAGLPYAPPWPVHHQVLLHQVTSTYDSCDGSSNEWATIPPVLKRAAMVWRENSYRVGRLGPAFGLRVAAAKAAVQPKNALLELPSVAAHSRPYHAWDWRAILRKPCEECFEDWRRRCNDSFHADMNLDKLFYLQLQPDMVAAPQSEDAQQDVIDGPGEVIPAPEFGGGLEAVAAAP
ncbi:hypothetical protein LTR56_007608 [Elasticomyces elasticus]|nr:hypothetical protein LTR56_007608 [Elasticomyces elasticus]KAK3665309.1 hypothetical protein LTR22_003831 [Elasticomyces elasticus]KAK4929718.1 hypothetical protein LTR49_003676 [Elasticomyces elasticus]KAK5761062.1 hypothetical protein LTS12_008739 [Elasticomyces elasticus]